jgi:hypothetical protein
VGHSHDGSKVKNCFSFVGHSQNGSMNTKLFVWLGKHGAIGSASRVHENVRVQVDDSEGVK